MTTLLMDIEAIRGLQEKMVATHNDLLDLTASLAGTLEGGKSNWMGNSANMYFQEFDSWQINTEKQIEMLNNLAEVLKNEIAEWELAASKLGA